MNIPNLNDAPDDVIDAYLETIKKDRFTEARKTMPQTIISEVYEDNEINNNVFVKTEPEKSYSIKLKITNRIDGEPVIVNKSVPQTKDWKSEFTEKFSDNVIPGSTANDLMIDKEDGEFVMGFIEGLLKRQEKTFNSLLHSELNRQAIESYNDGIMALSNQVRDWLVGIQISESDYEKLIKLIKEEKV